MVQFTTSNREFVKRPDIPPVCPKCGSHRTQIIGTFEDPTVVNVRCSNCGTVSPVRMESTTPGARSEKPERDGASPAPIEAAALPA